MQDTEYHEVNHVTVSVTDGYTEHSHHGEAQACQYGVDEVQHRCHEQEQELDRFCRTAHHAGNNAGDQQAFNFMTIFRAGAVVHRQRSARQAAEEGRHFPLREETRRTFREAVRGRAAQLGLEDGQRAANGMTANVHSAACFSKTDQGNQDVL